MEKELQDALHKARSYHPDFNRRFWSFTKSTDIWLMSGRGL
jgi:hypothetical protein